MFPLQRSDDIVRRPNTSASVHSQLDQIQEDLIIGGHMSNHVPQQVSNDEKKMEYKLKRIMHRDVERQRRQEMATLHASLRSLLPIEYIKGKRSISDHVDEAVNYIKHLQTHIQELHMQRDTLKNLPNCGAEDSSRSDRGAHICVTVNPCQHDLEILISDVLKDETINIPLSRVLWKLSEEGLSVVSCFSAGDKERSLHTIQCEVTDMTSFDLRKLQEEIADLICYNFNSE